MRQSGCKTAGCVGRGDGGDAFSEINKRVYACKGGEERRRLRTLVLLQRRRRSSIELRRRLQLARDFS